MILKKERLKQVNIRLYVSDIEELKKQAVEEATSWHRKARDLIHHSLKRKKEVR